MIKRSERLSFKNNNNKLDIYFGTFKDVSKDASIFSKKLDSTEFNSIFDLISSKNYSMKQYKQKLYQHGTNYYDIYSKKYVCKTNVGNIKSDKHLYITYLETQKENPDFEIAVSIKEIIKELTPKNILSKRVPIK